MYSASLIAAAIVQKAINEGNPVTQMKLQKMVYFAHGVNLAKSGAPLIKETIEAWKFGPVVPVIYQDYKLYGSSAIDNTDNIYDFPKNELKSNILDADALRSIDYTWNATNNLTAFQLSGWTHKTGSPWQKTYSEYDPNLPISNELIKEYFIDFLSQK